MVKIYLFSMNLQHKVNLNIKEILKWHAFIRLFACLFCFASPSRSFILGTKIENEQIGPRSL